MAKFEGLIAGKAVKTYRPKGNKKYSTAEFDQYLRKFQLSSALRLIGKISCNLLASNIPNYEIKGIPIFDGALAYIAMRLIKNSNDYRSKDMTLDDFLTVMDMYHGIPDPIEISQDNPEGCLIRFGSTQFEYDQELRHTLPRTLVLYRDLWNQVKEAQEVDVNQALESIYGLDIEEILFFAFAFSAKASKNEAGFFRILELEEIENFNNKLKKNINWEKQQQFIKNISSNYHNFRSELESESIPGSEYEKFRFNPLIRTPAITPDRNPHPGYSQMYIIPISQLLFRRVTGGLYFELADHFRTNKSNPFRNAFGHVFQEYVGLLLKKAFEGSNIKIHSEWKYGSKRKSKDTPDWLIVKDKSAILIEVKQSGLYLEAKKWGDLETIRNNLSQTITAGVKQMWKFEQDIQSNNYSELEWLSDVDIVEKIVITYDHSYFLNSTLRYQVKNTNTHIPADYHWHTIPIADFEYFIGIAGSNIFDFLRNKRLDKDADAMDFRDYYARICTQDQINNPYLSQVHEDYFNQLGLRD